jgi:hypothetical protein
MEGRTQTIQENNHQNDYIHVKQSTVSNNHPEKVATNYNYKITTPHLLTSQSFLLLTVYCKKYMKHI